MAAASSPEAQKELLLAAGIHEQVGWNWQPGLPLGEFQGVSVDGAGLVVGLDFSGQDQLEFDLAVFAPLTSLQVVDFKNCSEATGECWWTWGRKRSRWGWRGLALFTNPTSILHIRHTNSG